MMKNVKNDKVIKAITIGLSAMMGIMSMPVNVLAEENTDNENVSENPGESYSDQAEQISAASGETKDAVDNLSSENQACDDAMKESIEAAKSNVENADEMISNAESSIKEGQEQEDISATASTEATKNAGEAINQADAYQGEIVDIKQRVDAAAEAISEADTAVKVDQIVDEAKAEVEEAEKKCAEIEGEFIAAKEAYETAIKNMNQADADAVAAYEKAMNDYKLAADELTNAYNNLEAAKTAAEETVKAAETKLQELAKTKAAAEQDVKDIEEKISGEEDLIQKLKEQKSVIDKIDPVKKASDFWKENNTLTVGIVRYNLIKEMGSGIEDLQFSNYRNTGGVSNNYFVIASYTDKEGNKQYRFFDYTPVRNENDEIIDILVFEKTQYISYGIPDNAENVKIDSIKENGQIKVTYTLDNKNKVKNYFYPTFSEKGDKAHGVTYGDIIAANDNLKSNLESARTKADGLASDYSEGEINLNSLKNAVQVANDNVAIAQKAVSDLKDKVDKLNAKKEKSEEEAKLLALLKQNLDAAQSKLEQAKEEQKALDEQVKELEEKGNQKKEEIARIEAETSEETSADRVTSDSAHIVPDVVMIPLATEAATPSRINELGTAGAGGNFGNTSGVAGARTDKTGGRAIDADDENELAEEKLAGDKKNSQTDFTSVKEDKETAVVTINEGAVPLALADLDEAKKNMNWWWLLVVALLGTTGFEMYKKHEEKKSAATVRKDADK